MCIFIEILVRVASYGPQIDQSYGENRLSHIIKLVSIYTLSDLGDLSNLTGSLSRTSQQYSPPSEWIMCELGVFPTHWTKKRIY